MLDDHRCYKVQNRWMLYLLSCILHRQYRTLRGRGEVMECRVILKYCVKPLYRHGSLYKYIDRLMQDCSTPIAYALELLQSCVKPSIFYVGDLIWGIYSMLGTISSSSQNVYSLQGQPFPQFIFRTIQLIIQFDFQTTLRLNHSHGNLWHFPSVSARQIITENSSKPTVSGLDKL